MCCTSLEDLPGEHDEVKLFPWFFSVAAQESGGQSGVTRFIYGLNVSERGEGGEGGRGEERVCLIKNVCVERQRRRILKLKRMKKKQVGDDIFVRSLSS